MQDPVKRSHAKAIEFENLHFHPVASWQVLLQVGPFVDLLVKFFPLGCYGKMAVCIFSDQVLASMQHPVRHHHCHSVYLLLWVRGIITSRRYAFKRSLAKCYADILKIFPKHFTG